MSLGSGVIISADGYIVTNNHVVGENIREITVSFSDNREVKGRVIGTDPATDIALLKVDLKGLPPVAWGDSSKLQVGEWVLAIGSPFQLSRTVTAGIISATGRSNVGFSEYEDFIQTDAAINPGNSGGALINTRGELVGINTGIFSQSGGYQGIGFAVPEQPRPARRERPARVRPGAARHDRRHRDDRQAHASDRRRKSVRRIRLARSSSGWFADRKPTRPASGPATSSSASMARKWTTRRNCIVSWPTPESVRPAAHQGAAQRPHAGHQGADCVRLTRPAIGSLPRWHLRS